jgi:hypothetical protein
MLIRDVISRIKALYNKGAASDDSRLSNRHVYSKIRSTRSILIKREQDKKVKTNPWNIQVLNCIQLEVVDPSSCDCVISDGCKLLRSKCKLPKPITSKINTGIENVTTIDGSVVFSPTTWVKKRYKSGNKYTSNVPDYFIRDGYLYVTHNTLLSVIAVSGIFEDPYAVEEFNANGDCACDTYKEEPCVNPMDSELALDEFLIEPLMQLCVQELIQIFAAMPEDKDNDASSPNVRQQAPPSA